MKPIHFLFFILFSLTFSSCALNYTYTYKTSPTSLGKLKLLPTKPTAATYVTLDDSLIIENKCLKSLTIEHLPDGEYKICYAAADDSYAEKLDKTIMVRIENGKELTRLVSIPPSSSGFWIYAGLLTSTVYAILYIPYIMGQ